MNFTSHVGELIRIFQKLPHAVTYHFLCNYESMN